MTSRQPLRGLGSPYGGLEGFGGDERPMTPLNLIPQSSEDVFSTNLFENLRGFFAGGDSSFARDLNSSILPKDVNYYYSDPPKVLKATERVFAREKAEIERTVDEWLKQLLLVFENFKADLFRVLDDEQALFLEHYDGFRSKIDRFLDESRAKLNSSLSRFDAFSRNVRSDPNDPLDNQRMQLQLRRQQIDTIEEVFTDIKSSYNSSEIPSDKKVIERIFLEQERRRSRIDMHAINRNVRNIIDFVTSRLKEGAQDDVSRRPMSPIQSIAQGLHRPTSPVWPSSDSSKPSNGISQTLPTTRRPEPKKVTFEEPQEKDRLFSDGKTRPKLPPGLTPMNGFSGKDQAINIYKPSEGFQTPFVASAIAPKKADPRRPSSVNTQTLKPLSGSKLNSSFSEEPRSFTSVISVHKTNLLSKSNQIKPGFSGHLLLNDHLSKVTCFEIDTRSKMLIYGTSEGLLVRCVVTESPQPQLKDERRLQLDAPVLFLHQIAPDLLVVGLDRTASGLCLVQLEPFALQRNFKTQKERIKLVGFYDRPRFIAISEEEKIMIFDAGVESPRKLFQLKAGPVVDVVFASEKVMYSGSRNGEIRQFLIDFEQNSLSVQNSYRLDARAEVQIVALDVFHNNERLLIVTAREPNNRYSIHIVNAQTNKVMNVIRQIGNDGPIFALLTFTVVRKTPDIFLLSFKDNQIFFCDIDKKELANQITHTSGEAIHFRDDLPHKQKLVKILANDLSVSLLALTTNGIKLVKFH